jgi:anti-sigma factor RsiW
MDCGRVRAENVGERYLAGGLDEAGRDEFEEHYFACAACFADLEKLRALQAELARSRVRVEAEAAADRRQPSRWRWAAAAAAALAVFAVAVWQLVPRPLVETQPPAWRGPSAVAFSVAVEPRVSGGLRLTWHEQAHATTYIVKVFTSDGVRVFERQTRQPALLIAAGSLPVPPVGDTLVVRVEAIDAMGQVAGRSELIELPADRR